MNVAIQINTKERFAVFIIMKRIEEDPILMIIVIFLARNIIVTAKDLTIKSNSYTTLLDIKPNFVNSTIKIPPLATIATFALLLTPNKKF